MNINADKGLSIKGNTSITGNESVSGSLQVSGSITSGGSITAAGSITQGASDARLKDNKEPIQNALVKLNQLTGYEFDWNLDLCEMVGYNPTYIHEHGVIAQEVAAVVPDAVRPSGFNNEYLTVAYERLVPLLIEAIKELQREVAELKEVK